MKLTKQKLVTLIEAVILEAIEDDKIDWGSESCKNGLTAGNKRALKLMGKGQKQTEAGLRKYIAKATENANASFRAGYEFAFQLRFSAQLSTPIPDGQLPYSGAPQAPSWMFDIRRNRNRYRK